MATLESSPLLRMTKWVLHRLKLIDSFGNSKSNTCMTVWQTLTFLWFRWEKKQMSILSYHNNFDFTGKNHFPQKN